jgi:hypothetical protein
MSDSVQPVRVVADQRVQEVTVISHSPLFYWWPVWAVGFVMAAVSYWQGERVAFVPPGTVAESGVTVPGHDGKRDVLVAPSGKSFASATGNAELDNPQLRMASSNNPGVIWAMTLLLVILLTHVQLRGVYSLILIILISAATVVLAVLGLWDPILRMVGIVDIHINALGYLTISLILFAMWLVMFLVLDRLKYVIFTRGRLRVRRAIGEGEKVFDVRGMAFERHRDDLFRHWLLGFGTADLTVFTTGANARQIEMPNVFGIGTKLGLIHKMLQEMEVTPGG